MLWLPGIVPLAVGNIIIITNVATIVRLICSRLLGLDKGANIGKGNKATKLAICDKEETKKKTKGQGGEG